MEHGGDTAFTYLFLLAFSLMHKNSLSVQKLFPIKRKAARKICDNSPKSSGHCQTFRNFLESSQ